MAADEWINAFGDDRPVTDDMDDAYATPPPYLLGDFLDVAASRRPDSAACRSCSTAVA